MRNFSLQHRLRDILRIERKSGSSPSYHRGRAPEPLTAFWPALLAPLARESKLEHRRGGMPIAARGGRHAVAGARPHLRAADRTATSLKWPRPQFRIGWTEQVRLWEQLRRGTPSWNLYFPSGNCTAPRIIPTGNILEAGLEPAISSLGVLLRREAPYPLGHTSSCCSMQESHLHARQRRPALG